jgi:hypothetical protein
MSRRRERLPALRRPKHKRRKQGPSLAGALDQILVDFVVRVGARVLDNMLGPVPPITPPGPYPAPRMQPAIEGAVSPLLTKKKGKRKNPAKNPAKTGPVLDLRRGTDGVYR